MKGMLQTSSLIVVFIAVTFAASAADVSQRTPLSDAEWDRDREHVGLMAKISFFPSLLPVIMKNRDALELTTAEECFPKLAQAKLPAHGRPHERDH